MYKYVCMYVYTQMQNCLTRSTVPAPACCARLHVPESWPRAAPPTKPSGVVSAAPPRESIGTRQGAIEGNSKYMSWDVRYAIYIYNYIHTYVVSDVSANRSVVKDSAYAWGHFT